MRSLGARLREAIRRCLRRVVVFALDGQPALLAELIEAKDRVADALGDFDARLDDVDHAGYQDEDDVDRRIAEYCDDRFAETDHTHDYADEDETEDALVEIRQRLEVMSDAIAAMQAAKEQQR